MNDIYVEDLRDGRITPLTQSKSPDEINGTFDWVYEEEFDLRDGFRWSPGGHQIAYWQLNTEGVREYPLVNTTDSLYPRITPVKYPKVGERNAVCRVGVVSASGGRDLLDSHLRRSEGELRRRRRVGRIRRCEWPGYQGLVLQQFNRLQNDIHHRSRSYADVSTEKIGTDLLHLARTR